MTQVESIVNARRCLLVYAERHSVAAACRAFNVSRTTFYALKRQLLETGSIAPRARRKPKMPRETALSKKKLILRLVQQHPSRGPLFYSQELRRQGVALEQSTIWHHLRRWGMNRRFQRLVYLEQLQGKDKPLTEAGVRKFRRHQQRVRKALWPGQIVGVDTFYVGHLKGVGRIYQMSGIDIFSRFGWAQLYTSKEQRCSIDFVEQQLVPKFYLNGVSVEAVQTDNGSEFARAFEQMLRQYDIAHLRIPKGRPMYNGVCERFQRTILEECYKVAFRKRFFRSLGQLQETLDEYLSYYNFERPHSGANMHGETPINMLKTRSNIIRQKMQELLT